MKYEIKNVCTGEVNFTAEIDCKGDADVSIKRGLAVKWAIKNNADLRSANLSYADLRSANLSCADLSCADLRVLQTNLWTCYIQKQHIRIGCKYHTVSEWQKFSDEEISTMNNKALTWWKQWKPIIMAIQQTIEDVR